MTLQSARKVLSTLACTAALLVSTTCAEAQLRSEPTTTYELQQFTQDNSGLPSNTIKSLVCLKDGTIWVGTDRGLARFAEGQWQAFDTANSVLPDNEVGALSADSKGTVWVGTRRGVARIGSKWDVFTLQGQEASGYNTGVKAITVAPDGDVWFAYEQEVARLHDNHWQYYTSENSGLAGLEVNRFIYSADGRLFAGSDEGLQVFDEATAHWKTVLGGFSKGHLIFDLALAHDGAMWGATGDGLLKVEPEKDSRDRVHRKHTLYPRGQPAYVRASRYSCDWP